MMRRNISIDHIRLKVIKNEGAYMLKDIKINHLSESEIRKIGLQALEEKLGVVGTIRFLQQFDNGGSGDYTKEKYEKDDDILKIEEIIDSVSASFEMEGFVVTEEDRERGRAILSGEKDIEQVVKEINDKNKSK